MKNIYAIMVQNEDGIITLLELHIYYFWAWHVLKTLLPYYNQNDKLFIQPWNIQELVDMINNQLVGGKK